MSTDNHNHNPAGINQHGAKLKATDERLADALMAYHREMLCSNAIIAKRLQVDHGIAMSASTVKRRRKELGLYGSRAKVHGPPSEEGRQLVLKQLDEDPAGRKGVHAIWRKIAYDDRVHLKRRFVSDVMHLHAPDGFELREPTGKKCKGNQGG